MRKRALRISLGLLAVGAITLIPSVAHAQEPDPVIVLGQQVNLLWVVIGAVLVVFMQAGFALVETGFCRAKHAAHVVSTNFAIFGLGFVGFFFVGFPLAFGGFSYGTPADSWSFGLFEPIGRPPRRVAATGSSSGRAVGRSPVTGSRRRSSASSSTWSPSWTPSRRSRPARWPSAGSGAAS